MKISIKSHRAMKFLSAFLALVFVIALLPGLALTAGAAVSVTGVTLNQTSLTLTVNSKVTLTATVLPAGATNAAVSWASGDQAVATVANGVVTAVAVGATTITVTTADGGFTATCAVTVTNALQTITVTFDKNASGATTPSFTTKTVTVGGNFGTLPTTTLGGSIFTGWYTAASGGTQVTSSTIVTATANQTLYAQWIAGITVSFDKNCTDTTVSNPASITVGNGL
ncbi:MAG: Ig-like domain-containing protein, partial [Firmicutes bacterium]|nr:Ig-like domain-containing protein [Bacillota bacterium]